MEYPAVLPPCFPSAAKEAQETAPPKKHVGRPKKEAVSAPEPPKTGLANLMPPGDIAILGYAMGKLESLAETIARDNGLPVDEFVRQVTRRLAGLTAR